MDKEIIREVMKAMGSKGGKKSSANMTPEQRTERARKAVQARIKKNTL